MPSLSFQFIFISFLAFAATTLAKVRANQTFRFVNEGEFGDRIIEYDASYGVIENDVYSFYTFPFRLCFYNTNPDAHIFAIRAGIPRDESLMRIKGRNKLVSRTSDVDGSDGPYSIVLARNGFVMYLKYSGQQLIYGGWRIKDFGDIVTFDALPENENATAYELVLTHLQANQSTTSTAGNGRRLLQVRPIGGGSTYNLNKLNYNATISFLRLGPDRNLRAFTYYDKVSYLKWDESFAFFSSYFVRGCALPSKCGAFGLCDKRMCVACLSPKGLLGWSESCKPPKPVPCQSGAKVDYYKIVGVEHFLNAYLDDGEGPMKVEQCRGEMYQR
ncbi:hypothetical protein V6N13_129104 [Hibiscus sabdariffa]